ncbi:MAG: transporter substrate-binding domain-containing protein [Candidatus Rhabdochlamydia sp.]
MKTRKIFYWVAPLLLLLMGMLKMPPHEHVVIALDSSWHTLTSSKRASSITAFTTELLTLIAKKENLSLTLSYQNWDYLLPGLLDKEYTAVCSNLEPHLYYEKTYLFSDNYLETGMVILGRKPFNAKAPKVAVLNHAVINMLLTHFPTASYELYETVSDALDDILVGLIDGVVIDRLTAEAYVSNLYPEQMDIIFPSLDHEGLKLITLVPDEEGVIRRFNKGLLELKKAGIYDLLLKKWGLNAHSLS